MQCLKNETSSQTTTKMTISAMVLRNCKKKRKKKSVIEIPTVITILFDFISPKIFFNDWSSKTYLPLDLDTVIFHFMFQS